MKIKHQLSIATLLMAGVFVTGCSQQTAGDSQVSGSSQVAGGSQQSSGGSQVAGSSQGGSQQQIEDVAPVVTPAEPTPTPAPAPKQMVKPTPKPQMARPPVRTNRWAHTHPAVPRCTKSVRHTHKYNQARHSHKYSCKGMRPAPKRMMHKKPEVDVYALQRKLKAKGYYKGPIDGIVGPGTRSALQRFMKR